MAKPSAQPRRSFWKPGRIGTKRRRCRRIETDLANYQRTIQWGGLKHPLDGPVEDLADISPPWRVDLNQKNEFMREKPAAGGLKRCCG
jgi:hypothetical protein